MRASKTSPGSGRACTTRPGRHRERIPSASRVSDSASAHARRLVRHLEQHPFASRTMRATPCPARGHQHLVRIRTVLPVNLARQALFARLDAMRPCSVSGRRLDNSLGGHGRRRDAQPAPTPQPRPDQAPHQGFSRRRFPAGLRSADGCRLVCHNFPLHRAVRASQHFTRWAHFGSGALVGTLQVFLRAPRLPAGIAPATLSRMKGLPRQRQGLVEQVMASAGGRAVAACSQCL